MKVRLKSLLLRSLYGTLGEIATRRLVSIYRNPESCVKDERGGPSFVHRIVRSANALSCIGRMPAAARTLVISFGYPSYTYLYRNGFIHRRVLGYRSRGLPVDVFDFQPDANLDFRTFDGVQVTQGGARHLKWLLDTNAHDTILVHFLMPAMWDVLRPYMDNPKRKMIVWLHGCEVQPWYRRAFNYTKTEERELAKQQSETRMAFWKGLLTRLPDNVKLVFVSAYFANEVMEDVGVSLKQCQYEIIHNYIDTELFGYVRKPADHRKRVLMIRSFRDNKYANDLAVAAITLLSREPWFGELEFRIVGDGRLFQETVQPLRSFTNVHIDQGFLMQEEIAALQRQYGIFLCPTRWDSHGVSRDEAMSCGLVPVTNRVAAIPEFADETCAVLANPDDAKGLAEGIRMLVHNPDLFRKMSSSAAARVRNQCAHEHTILRECRLIRA